MKNEEVRKHVLSWTMGDMNGIPFGMIGDEIIPNLDMVGALSARCFAILFHFNGTFVVLVEDCLSDLITLGFQK